MLADIFNWTERAGGAGLGWVLAANLWAGAVCLAAIAIDTLLARRVSARARMLLYAAVAVRIALPLDWHSPVGVVPAGTPPAGTLAPMAENFAIMYTDAPAPAVPSVALAGVVLTWRTWALLAYAAVAGAMLWRWGRSAAAARGVVARSRPLREPRVLVHEALGPAVVGLWRPVAVIPAWLTDPQRRDELACVLRHERAHLGAGDPLLAFAMHAAVIALWPVAAVWVAASRVRSLMELAADESALRGQGPEGRVAYGRTLLRVSQSIQGDPSMRASIGFGNSIRSRIVAAAHRRRWPRAVQLAGIAGLSVALVACAARNGSTAGTGGRAPGSDASAAAGQLADPRAIQAEGFPLRIMWMCNIWRVPADFDLSAALEGIGQAKGGVGELRGDEQAAAFFRRLDGMPGGVEYISTPTVLTNVDQEATVSIGDADKAHNVNNQVEIKVRGGLPREGTIAYSFDAVQGDSTITRKAECPASGFASIVVSPPNNAGWRSMVMVRPTLISSREQMPVQREGVPLSAPVRVEGVPIPPPPPPPRSASAWWERDGVGVGAPPATQPGGQWWKKAAR